MVRPRILVVDDDQAIVELLRDLLVDEDYDVLTPSALPPDPRAITRSKPDLLILDDLIGTESVGWRVVRELRASLATARLPIILCTAAMLAPDLLAQLQRLQVVVVPKPFAIDDLLARVEQLLLRIPADRCLDATNAAAWGAAEERTGDATMMSKLLVV